MISLGRALMWFGLSLFAIGALLYLVSRFNLPLGRLPGDIRIRGERFTCVFPLATSILLSVILTIVLNLVARYLNR